MQNRVGQQFGNYRLLHLLGRGGFAEVYLGEHVYMQSKAAVKVLYGPLITSDAQSFLQEARTLASLEHPHIVGIKEFDIKEDVPFLVMNYASNGTLRQRHAKGQPVPLGTVVSYVLQVASALQYAHDRHIVHRDLKPENMLIDANNQILLSDFGIAVLTLSGHPSVVQGPAGTYSYMAPEQITGNAVPASDQYALGITVYEWLCGEVPFVGSMKEITSKHLHALLPPLRDKGIVIDPQVEVVVRQALAKDPQHRFASVQEFALALQSSSKAQQSGSMSSLTSNSEGSIVLSPSDKTPGFTQDSASLSSPAQPHLTPRITQQVNTSPTGLPSPQLPPTIYPYNPQPLAPARPAGQYPQPRRAGSQRLVITLISVVLLLVIGSSAIFAILRSISLITLPVIPAPAGWPIQTSGTSNTLHGVAWSGTQFVAMGSSGTILTSPDGHTWTLQPFENADFNAVTWSGTQFVAAGYGYGATIQTSPDGRAWTAQSFVANSGLVPHAVIWSGTQFVAVGEGGTIITSPDGRSWTDQSRDVSSSVDLNAVTWSGTQFVAVGSSGTILTSPDGYAWTPRRSGTPHNLHGVVWSDSQFVAVGDSGTILTSPDGLTWTAQSSGTSNNLYSVAWSGSRFVAVGGSGTILTSP